MAEISKQAIIPGTHAGHNHEHRTSISKRWKWATVLGSAAIGACELISGGLGTLSVTADGLHNAGDVATYYLQAENILNPELSEQKRLRARKLTHWIITATSLAVGARAGVDLGLTHEATADPFSIYTASASLALNGLLFARLRQGQRKQERHADVHEHTITKHFLAVDLPSTSIAVTGAVLQKYGYHVAEDWAAIAGGAVGMWAFRPTPGNLAHNCLDPDHGTASHETHHHTHGESTNKKHWFKRTRHTKENEHRPSKLRVAMGMGAAALSLVGLLSSDMHANNEPRANSTTMSVDIGRDNIQHPHAVPHARATPITECVTIESGDFEWSLTVRTMQKVLGVERPTIAATNAFTMFTASENEQAIPNPNVINPGSCLEVPTPAAAQILYDAVTWPQTNPQLAEDLQVFDDQSNISDVMNQQADLSRIDNYLVAALASE